ncbi:Major facilitator superfamily transporter [Pleurostoma richardsiae]|uniref:Major facilitator superfamily transporter n=1 Tax=Pleurostoma richardsiae TaxID=41990 RepID=A0AA38RCL1_9PEZI|nr:Major facilitator superfamily transporter [Pleurostoma richardsiae]
MGPQEIKDGFGPDVENPDVERIESTDAVELPAEHGTGTVQLFDKNTVVLIPTPSPDPKDPLNLPLWHKGLIVLTVGLYSAFSVLGTSGLGAVFPTVSAMYPGQEERATDLLTYPTLFMGIGNLLSMPLCVAIGRRPVFLISLVVLVASGIWCACAKDLGTHIAGRDVFSLAAGQSEALAPMMVQEIHFLHERGNRVAWFISVQAIGTAAMFLATTYIAPAWGISWWYWIITIVNGAILVLAFCFVVETKFERPHDANDGNVHLHFDEQGNVIQKGGREMVYRVTTAENHVLEPEKYGPRTWRHDLKLLHSKPEWRAMLTFYKETGQGLVLPTILWLILLNGAFLGVYVFQSSTFGTILTAAPYNFKSGWLGFIQMAQIVDCLVMLPILGYGSDFIAKMMSRQNKGLFEPEYRLLTLIIPTIAAVISCVIYGRAGAHPDVWSWSAVAVPYTVCYFAFLGVNLVGITYAVDSFPEQAGPLLLLICAGRGFIAFGLSYSTVPFANLIGYDGAMNVFAIICGVLSACGILAYVFGKTVRQWAHRRVWKEV